MADTVEDYSDTLAERAAALGGTAQGTVQVAAQRSFLVPYVLGIADEEKHIFALSASLGAFGESARQAIDEAAEYGDADTADGIDHQLWFVESHLTPKGFSDQ